MQVIESTSTSLKRDIKNRRLTRTLRDRWELEGYQKECYLNEVLDNTGYGFILLEFYNRIHTNEKITSFKQNFMRGLNYEY